MSDILFLARIFLRYYTFGKVPGTCTYSDYSLLTEMLIINETIKKTYFFVICMLKKIINEIQIKNISNKVEKYFLLIKS